MSLTWGGRGSVEPAHREICGPGDTLHSIPRAVALGGGILTRVRTRSDLDLEPSGLGEFSPVSLHMPGLRWSHGYVNVGGARSERASRRRWPMQHGKASRHPAQSLQVRAPGEEVAPLSWLPPLPPPPTHRGQSPGTACGPRPPHCSPHTQTGLSPGGWGL